MTQHDGTDDDRLHPAAVRARDLRRRAGLPASLVDVDVLSRVIRLFENFGAAVVQPAGKDHEAA